jgi:hypothetical protein
MAHFWILDDDSREWTPTPLVGDAVALVNGAFRRADDTPPVVATQARIILRRLADPPNTWALLSTSCALRLNGALLPLGLAVLDDRDEIRLPALTAWFSTETQARVEPFPESTPRGFCPRCKQAIAAATPAVRCPTCGLWHHASDDLPCWAYATTCAACAQDTALDAGFRWTPEDL